ncbi:WD repeat-containing protein 93 isoform X2 [Macrotis lagotis]
MPVYIRKGPLEIPTYEEQDWIKDEEGDYFLKDPDQILDSLPQPFRMINKLVNLIFDRAWEIIEEKQARKAVTIRKIQPTVYLPTQKLQLSSVPNCITFCKDHVFVGSSSGLKIFNALFNYSQICSWETSKSEIMSIWARKLQNEVFVATLDEMGVVHVFYFYKEFLYLIKGINEVEDISKQTTCLNLQVSPVGHFMAILLQAGTGDVWLEVYRLPKDAWLKEVANFHSILQSKKKTSHLHLENYSVKADIKLSSPILILKLKPPKPVTGTPFKSPLEFFQKMDDRFGLGSGQNHLIKDSQLEQQTAVFEILFKKFVHVECPEKKSSIAMFHFLLPGRMMMLPIETKASTDMCYTLGIHWPGNNNFFLYSLFRSPKEKETEKGKDKEKMDFDQKPDGVWPTAAPITNSAFSPCTSYLLLACEDGVLMLWDRANGFLLGVVSLPEGCSCKSIHFLKNIGSPNECLFPQVGYSSEVQVLVLCTDGSLHLVKGEKSKNPSISVVMERPVKNPNETVCTLAPIPFLPSMILLFIWDGSVYIMDMTKSQIICELGPSPTYCLGNPWQPVFALSSDGQQVFIRGDKQDRALHPKENYCIFVFKLASYQLLKPSLSKDESSQPSSSEIINISQNFPLDKRCEIFLQNR